MIEFFRLNEDQVNQRVLGLLHDALVAFAGESMSTGIGTFSVSSYNEDDGVGCIIKVERSQAFAASKYGGVTMSQVSELTKEDERIADYIRANLLKALDVTKNCTIHQGDIRLDGISRRRLGAVEVQSSVVFTVY